MFSVLLMLSSLIFQVPPSVKALYSSPLPDVFQVPPVSRSILTAGEMVERWRREEERERRVMASPRQPAFTQDQDEVRNTCLCSPVGSRASIAVCLVQYI